MSVPMTMRRNSSDSVVLRSRNIVPSETSSLYSRGPRRGNIFRLHSIFTEDVHQLETEGNLRQRHDRHIFRFPENTSHQSSEYTFGENIWVNILFIFFIPFLFLIYIALAILDKVYLLTFFNLMIRGFVFVCHKILFFLEFLLFVPQENRHHDQRSESVLGHFFTFVLTVLIAIWNLVDDFWNFITRNIKSMYIFYTRQHQSFLSYLRRRFRNDEVQFTPDSMVEGQDEDNEGVPLLFAMETQPTDDFHERSSAENFNYVRTENLLGLGEENIPSAAAPRTDIDGSDSGRPNETRDINQWIRDVQASTFSIIEEEEEAILDEDNFEEASPMF